MVLTLKNESLHMKNVKMADPTKVFTSYLAFRPQPVSQREHYNLHSFLLACNSDWIPKQLADCCKAG